MFSDTLPSPSRLATLLPWSELWPDNCLEVAHEVRELLWLKSIRVSDVVLGTDGLPLPLGSTHATVLDVGVDHSPMTGYLFGGELCVQTTCADYIIPLDGTKYLLDPEGRGVQFRYRDGTYACLTGFLFD